MKAIHAATLLTVIVVGLAACETTVVPPGYEENLPEDTVVVPEPEDEVSVEGFRDPDITAVGPECLDDDDCRMDDACPTPGGCDGDPCRDDRCVVGQCIGVDIEGCDPGYQIKYRYRSCCDWRTLTLAPDGRCTFEIDGEPARRCDDVTPHYVQALVERAGFVGFFHWGLGHCVPGVTQADFSLYLSAGDLDNEVFCEQGVCVGELCNVLDGVWATLPSNWHDGCGCE